MDISKEEMGISHDPPPPPQVMRETNNSAYVEDTKMIEVIKSTEGRKTHKENKMQGGWGLGFYGQQQLDFKLISRPHKYTSYSPPPTPSSQTRAPTSSPARKSSSTRSTPSSMTRGACGTTRPLHWPMYRCGGGGSA